MSCNGIDAGTAEDPACARTHPNLLGDENHKLFRRRLGILAILLLLVNLAIGLSAHRQQRSLADYSIGVYDTTILSTNYIHQAQISFRQYAEQRIRADGPDELLKAHETLTKTIAQLDAEIERTNSALARTTGIAAKEKLASLFETSSDAAGLAVQLLAISGAMEQLGGLPTDVLLRARDDVAELAHSLELTLLTTIMTSIMLAGLALLSLDRMVTTINVSRALFSASLEGMPQGLSVVDRDLRLLVCNTKYAQMCGLDQEHTKFGTPLRAILMHQAATATGPVDFMTFMNETLAQAADPTPGTREHQYRDGRIITVSSAPLPTGGAVAIHTDVTERRRIEKEVEFLARHDALTGLANRLQHREFIEKYLEQVTCDASFTIFCLDLDHFKNVNDTLGHTYGDALLCGAAERLRSLIRDTDLIARTGGDEFSIVQINSPRHVEAAACFAERIIAAMRMPFDLGDHQVMVGTSVGIAMAPCDGAELDQIMKNADMALYRAKTDGRGTYHFFETDMDTKAQARRVLEMALRKAIVAGELELEYQPIVNLAQNRISGFEALLRWNHPTRGKIPPLEFIALAEDTGLIIQIGEWVLGSACAEAATWPDNLRVAINVSPLQCRNKNLAASIASTLAAFGLSPDRLELEITEAVLLHNDDVTRNELHKIRALGVRISMDDFGTGYSSLSYLRSFPFDKIKIDRSFIHDLTDNPQSIGIIRAVAALGKSFSMVTTAEGVETQEQLEQVRAEGCTEVQGFAYSKAVPTSRISAVLEEFSKLAKAAA